jgi:ribosome biogenesis protein Tsr3
VLNSDFLEQKRLNDTLQSDLSKQDEQIETFKKVIVSCSWVIARVYLKPLHFWHIDYRK